MPHDFNSNTDNKDEWLTPLWVIDALGEFDLDPCSPINRPWDTAIIHYNINDDGLSQPWFGRVWCNPPYGRETWSWADRLATHGDGILLIFARTETRGFHEHIWDRASSVFFFRGRLRFHHVTGEQGGTANAPSCLVAYGEENTQSLAQCNLDGKLIHL